MLLLPSDKYSNDIHEEYEPTEKEMQFRSASVKTFQRNNDMNLTIHNTGHWFVPNLQTFTLKLGQGGQLSDDEKNVKHWQSIDLNKK